MDAVQGNEMHRKMCWGFLSRKSSLAVSLYLEPARRIMEIKLGH
jgi:hypothetical protein